VGFQQQVSQIRSKTSGQWKKKVLIIAIVQLLVCCPLEDLSEKINIIYSLMLILSSVVGF